MDTLHISADLFQSESVLAYSSHIQPFPSPNPRSKVQQRTSVQPAKVAKQLKSGNPALQAPRQLESRIWGQGCSNQKILSSYLLL